MSLEEEKKVNQNEWVRWLLNENHKAELWEILAFWEKYKMEWEEMERKFWNKYWYDEFMNLILQYKESEEKLEEWLLPEERKMLNSLNDIMREKFCEEYLKDRILYSWDLENEKEREALNYDERWYIDWVKDSKDKLQPWMGVDLTYAEIWYKWVGILAEWWKNSLQPWMVVGLGYNNIWDEWLAMLAKEWGNGLKPWMEIGLWDNRITDKWIVMLVKEWRGKLQPWMKINLEHNEIWDAWLKVLAREWKDSLQPWMYIDLKVNSISDEWIKILAKEWKGKLQPWMHIDLSYTEIWDEWVQAIMDNLELKEWVIINLSGNNISKWKIEDLIDWVQWYKNRWINCNVELQVFNM